MKVLAFLSELPCSKDDIQDSHRTALKITSPIGSHTLWHESRKRWPIETSERRGLGDEYRRLSGNQ